MCFFDRLKTYFAMEASIIDLCTKMHTHKFKGDVLVVYGPVFSKNTSSPAKAQLMHVDLTDKNGQMTISVTIANHLIQRFRPYFSLGSSVCISNFTLKQKTTFERGDVDTCIHLTTNTIVENIPPIRPTRRLVPNTTIHDLRLSKSG